MTGIFMTRKNLDTKTDIYPGMMLRKDKDKRLKWFIYKPRNDKDCQQITISLERKIEQILPHSPWKKYPEDTLILNF